MNLKTDEPTLLCVGGPYDGLLLYDEGFDRGVVGYFYKRITLDINIDWNSKLALQATHKITFFCEENIFNYLMES